MADKRQKATKVKCKRGLYSYRKKYLSFAGARSQMNTTLYQNRPGETENWTNLHLETHTYRVYYVNVDVRHQYGIYVAESQTFLLAKRLQRRRARRNGCFRRLVCWVKHFAMLKVTLINLLLKHDWFSLINLVLKHDWFSYRAMFAHITLVLRCSNQTANKTADFSGVNRSRK